VWEEEQSSAQTNSPDPHSNAQLERDILYHNSARLTTDESTAAEGGAKQHGGAVEPRGREAKREREMEIEIGSLRQQANTEKQWR